MSNKSLRSNVLANLPPELQRSSRWVLWRLEDTPPKDGKAGRPRCKIPKKCTNPAMNASSTGPDSWGSLEVALNNLELLKPLPQYEQDRQAVGVGLVFGAPYFGVDLDKCYDPGTETIQVWASELLSKLPPTYLELSPSGHGFHLWYKCAEHSKLKDGIRTDKAEVYARGRYFTMSGEPFEFPGWDCETSTVTDLDLKESNKVFALISDFKEKKDAPKQQAQQNSAKLQELMTRIDFPDLSQAVQSLLTILAIETVCDAKQIEERFKQSRLYQETHWHEKWERLGAGEIAKAIEFGRENLQKRAARKSRRVEYEATILVRKASEITLRHQKYWWEPWLPIGQLVHFGGGQGQGKTPVILDLAARMTAGTEWPDGSGCGSSRSVLLLNMEDDVSAVTIPRFKLAGGDVDKLYVIEATKLQPVDDPEAMALERAVALDKDIEQLRKVVAGIEDLGLVIIDPITNYLGQAKMNAEEEVRAVLTPLALLAQQLGITITTVGHFNKKENTGDPLQRIMGAAAFTGVARGVVLFGPDPEVESAHHHIMTLGRGAVEQGGLKYHTEVEHVEWDGDKSKVVRICWDGHAEVHADDAVTSVSRESKSKLKEAAECLKEFLRAGKKPANECLAYLERMGFDPKVCSPTRVRKKAGAGTRQEGSRNHVWFLETGYDSRLSSDGKMPESMF